MASRRRKCSNGDRGQTNEVHWTDEVISTNWTANVQDRNNCLKERPMRERQWTADDDNYNFKQSGRLGTVLYCFDLKIKNKFGCT